MNDLQAFFRNLLKQGNERTVELRNPEGRSVFRLGVTWAALLGLLTLFTKLLPIVAIAAVVLLVLKYQFAVVKQVSANEPVVE